MKRRVARSLLGALAAGACGRSAPNSGELSAPSGASSSGGTAGFEPISTPASGLAPLRGEPPVIPLVVEGFPDAIISVPLGATSPRPVVVATHGMWDPPEGLCDDQRWIFQDRAWVVCPRAASILRKAGVDARAVLAKRLDAGRFIHWYNGPVAEETRVAEPWLFEGDARWGADCQGVVRSGDPPSGRQYPPT